MLSTSIATRLVASDLEGQVRYLRQRRLQLRRSWLYDGQDYNAACRDQVREERQAKVCPARRPRVGDADCRDQCCWLVSLTVPRLRRPVLSLCMVRRR
jgi:hypothetical protein